MKDVDGALLGLYEAAQSAPPHDFGAFLFSWLGARIPFDSGGIGAVMCKGDIVQQQLGGHLYRQPVEKLLAYSEVAPWDIAAQAMIRNPGKAGTYCVPQDASHDRVKHYGRRFGVAQSLAYCTRKGDAANALALWRGSARKSFLAGQARLIEVLAPHLFLASRINATRVSGLGPNEDPAGTFVIADRAGFIIASTPLAIQWLGHEWPQWGPPVLPRPLMDALASASAGAHWGRTLQALASASGELLVIRLRSLDASGVLTPAQARVAAGLCRPGSYKDIARELQISPATVRNHAHAIYSKLGLGSRAGLAEKLASARQAS